MSKSIQMIRKKILKFGFKILGYQIHRISNTDASNAITMEGALKRCVNRGLHVNTVIDVGASDGRWSKSCMRYLPDIRYLLIEAQKVHEPGLKQLKDNNPNVEYVLAAAGKKKGKSNYLAGI